MYRKARTILLICAAILIVALIILALVLRPSAPQETAPPTEPAATQQTVVSPSVTMPTPVGAETAAVDVIRHYLEFWGQKNTEGMEALLIRADRGKTVYDEMKYEASLEIKSLEERPAEEAAARFDPAWYGNETPADIALVMANYTITYNEEGRELYVRDGLERTEYLFWLVLEDGTWKIAMQGY